jgi:hypothetical protein
MLRATRRVHVRTGLISLESRTYQASRRLAGQTVEVCWHAGDAKEVQIFVSGKFVETAKLVTPTANIDFTRKHQNVKDDGHLPLSSSKNYARKLMDGHQGETGLASQQALSDEYLSQQETSSLFREHLQRDLSEEEMSMLVEFVIRHAPLRKSEVTSALSVAISAKGTDRHMRYYLEQLELNGR